VAGIVDFDVLDGLDEFVEAGRLLGVKACVGLETRVYLPEFSDVVVNSPGEPGVAYLMGVGFPSQQLPASSRDFLRELRNTSERRNREVLARVNAHLSPAALDYDEDVLPLTPSGNATERHICLAYARKAHSLFPKQRDLAAFWSRKLSLDASQLDLPEGFDLQSAIRTRTMKRGGVGYVQPGRGSFPEMAETSRFILQMGGIPTHCWLDGTSEGEARIEELLEGAIAAGIGAVDIIVDPNYAACPPEVKVRNMFHLVDLIEELGLIAVVGTEMNLPGQKLVDDAASEQLAPLLPIFLKGAHIVYAHSVLQRVAGIGHTSDWASRHFMDRMTKNEFFRAVGETLQPGREQVLEDLPNDPAPELVLESLRS
jgi:hypothetical protein